MNARSLSIAVATVALGSASVAHADFSGSYDHSNWTLATYAGGDGHVDFADATTLVLVGSDNGIGDYTDYLITAAADGTVSFDWSYDSIDIAPWDNASYWYGGDNFLTDTAGQSGSVSFGVVAGDTFGFTVFSEDGLFGAGVLTITNFEGPEAVPEPASMAVLGLGAAAFLRRRNKKA